MKKHTLLIDGNHMLFKCLYVIPRKGKVLLDEEDEQAVLVQKLAMDLAAEIRKFNGLITRIVFTVDSSSWRKDVYPDKEYKGNRVQDTSVNWDNVFSCFKDFCDIISRKGVTVHRVPGAEGDDIIFAWSNFLNYKGENVIINSGDRDLTQLIGLNDSTQSYTIFYNNTQKVFVTYPGFMKWLNEVETKTNIDIFNLSTSMPISNMTKNTFKDLVKNNKLEISEVKSELVVFKKILAGDAGDNIMAAYSYLKMDKNGKNKKFGISDKKVDLILEKFESKNGKFQLMYLFEADYKKELVNSVIECLSIDKSNFNSILKNLEVNINLVTLHIKTIPENIQNQLFEEIEVSYKNDMKNINIFTDRNKILEDTKYKNASYSPRGFNSSVKEDKSKLDFIIKPTSKLF